MPDTTAITAERARVGDISRVIAQSRGRITPGIVEYLNHRAYQSGRGQACFRGGARGIDRAGLRGAR